MPLQPLAKQKGCETEEAMYPLGNRGLPWQRGQVDSIHLEKNSGSERAIMPFLEQWKVLPSMLHWTSGSDSLLTFLETVAAATVGPEERFLPAAADDRRASSAIAADCAADRLE